MTTSLLQEGLELAGFGMGMVFLFLTLLVLVTSAMSWIIQQYFASSLLPADLHDLDARELAAAAAAVQRYRQEHKNA